MVGTLAMPGCSRNPADGENTMQVTTVQISEITSNSRTYQDKKVTVRGRAFPGLAFQFEEEIPYLLQDKSGRIWVITKSLPPSEGEKVEVTGTVSAPYQIKGRHYQIVIVEETRRSIP